MTEPHDHDEIVTASEGLDRRSPLIFISHDSEDALIAEAFSKLLSSVSAGMLKSFRSSDKKGSQGFEYGVEWYPELMKTLDSATDVVCLLTQNGINRPWLLYEAGVAKGKLDIPVHGLALGVPLQKASVGPFAQFQNCGDDVEAVTKLAMQLVRRLPGAEPDFDTIRSQVEVFKASAEECLKNQPLSEVDSNSGALSDSSSAMLFEEVKIMFQELPARIKHDVIREQNLRRHGPRRVHPGMVEEIVDHVTRGEARPSLLAIIASSYVRDDLPWIYEIATQAYRAHLSGDFDLENRAMTEFMRAWEISVIAQVGPPISSQLRDLLSELHGMMNHHMRMTTDEDQFRTP